MATAGRCNFDASVCFVGIRGHGIRSRWPGFGRCDMLSKGSNLLLLYTTAERFMESVAGAARFMPQQSKSLYRCLATERGCEEPL
jgi:hypothetical protein